MPRIENKEIMVGVHFSVRTEGNVTEEMLDWQAERIAMSVHALLTIGNKGNIGVTTEEIRGGEDAPDSVPNFVMSATPAAWPIGALITCAVPEREGEAPLMGGTFYVLKQYDESIGMVAVINLLTPVTASADRFLYIYDPSKKVGNGQ